LYHNFFVCSAGVVELAKAAYQEAMEIATSKIAAINPTRLGLALNFSVFNFEILKSVDEARKVAQKVGFIILFLSLYNNGQILSRFSGN
jgi:predicted subunit of tRNA(5-methylaminomethyl-2-thiouridylate) methyltransferase